MMRTAFCLAGLVLFTASPVAAQQAPVAAVPTVREGADAIPREVRAKARRECYADNVALEGADLRAAMRTCLQAKFPGVQLYAADGLTRDGKPTAAAARAACKEEAQARGLNGSDRSAALIACFNAKRPDLAQRAECRKDVRAKGLEGPALREAVAACAAAGRS